MAIVEGRGRVAPSPILSRLDAADMELVERLGPHRANFRGYAKRKDPWGRGLVPDPIRVGLIGQLAVKRWIDRLMNREICVMDERDKIQGDGGIDLDLPAARYTLEVKTARKPADLAGPMLVRHVDDAGNLKPLVADAFVYVANGTTNRPELLGWIERTRVESSTFRRSPRHDSRHWNLEIPRTSLKQMKALISLLIARCATYANGGAACR